MRPLLLLAVCSLVACSAPTRSASLGAQTKQAPPSARSTTDDPGGAAPRYDASEVKACAEGMDVPESRGIVVMPRAAMQASLLPTYRALCTCLPHDAAARVRVRLFPEEGRSEAEVDDAALASCVRREMGAGTIPVFPLRSDCLGCGPRPFEIGHGAPAPAKPSSSSITLSLRFVRP